MFSRIETSSLTSAGLRAAMAYRSSLSVPTQEPTESPPVAESRINDPPDRGGGSSIRSSFKSQSSLSLSLDLSSSIRTFRDSLRTSTSQSMNINLKLDFSMSLRSSSDLTQGVVEPQLEKDLEFILRALARDEDEFKELKTRFRNLFSSISSSLEGLAGSQPCAQSGDLSYQGNSSGISASMKELSVKISLDIRLKATARSITPLGFESIADLVEVQGSDPLILDLDGDGLELTSYDQGPLFDILARGKPNQVSWVRPDDGFLVLDRNGNGTIDSGRELFGDQNGAADGFLELARFDSDSNGRIDKGDPIYDNLQVFRDLNQDGKSQASELKSLRELDITSISLAWRSTHGLEVAGNPIPYEAWYETSGGQVRTVGEAMLDYIA